MKSFVGLRYATMLEFAGNRNIAVFVGADGLIYEASEYLPRPDGKQVPRIIRWQATA